LTAVEPRDRLLLGGWFDGERITLPHLLVADWGAWTGGTGPLVLGGLTLIRLAAEQPAFVSGAISAAVERMKSVSFRGLFHCDVEEQPATGEMRLRGLSCGWPFLHTQAFLAELKSLSDLLSGKSTEILRKYVTVLPVTIPPWPNEKQQNYKGMPIEGLTIQQQGKMFWFDLQVDKVANKLMTAGLDGFIAVATGYSDSTPALARARALELAFKTKMEGKQWRSDAGLLVDPVLSTLEEKYGFVV